MQSTNLEQIKVALWEQAFSQCTRVRWGMAQVVAIRCRQGHLLALLCGYKGWYPVESVTIERNRPKGCLTHITPTRCKKTCVS